MIGVQRTDRGVSIAVSHVLTLAVTKILLSMLLMGASSVLEAETDRSVEGALETIGERLATEPDSAGRLMADGSRETVTIRADHPRTVSNSAYTDCLRLSATDADVVYVPLADGITVEESSVSGGAIDVVGDGDGVELQEAS